MMIARRQPLRRPNMRRAVILFPSGLTLYWLVQNILTIIQMSIMNKWWKDHPEPPAATA